MITRKMYPRRGVILLTLWVTLLTAGLSLSLTGSANAQTATAREDSLSRAFFLLKYDHALLSAKYTASARVDSLRLDQMGKFYAEQLKAEREMRRRIYTVMLLTALVTGGLFYAGSLSQ